MYKIEFSKIADKQLSKLEMGTQIRIGSSLQRIRIRPYPHIKKLVGSPYFSLRTGAYRIVLDINDGKLIILVIELGHRKNIYKV